MQYNTLSDGTIEYTINGKFHRANGPARIWGNMKEAWWLNDLPHRYYGAQASFHNWWMIHGRFME
jgi:hypothetical protein